MKRVIVAWAATVSLVACGEYPQPVVPIPPLTSEIPSASGAAFRAEPGDDSFRASAPKPGDAVKVDAPVPEVFTLRSGIKVYLIERHDLPIVSVRLASKRSGAWYDCNGPTKDCAHPAAGARAFAVAMLEQGTKSYNALQMSDAFEAIGAQHGTWADWDSTGVFIKVTADQLGKGLDLMAEVALRPTFPKAEFDRQRVRRLASARAEKDSLSAMAANAIAHSVFDPGASDHYSLSGSPAELEALKIDQVERAYRDAFTPNLLGFLIAGDVTRAAITPMLEARFAIPRSGFHDKPAQRKSGSGVVRARAIVLVDKPAATQSYVALALLGPDAHTTDRDALALMNVILGGSFSSRVNMNLREKNAYTYGARSRFSMRQWSGLFTVGGNMVADKTGAAVVELLAEFDKIQAEPATESELTDARESILMALPGRMESVMELGSMAADLFIYGYKEDELRTLPDRLAKVTIADIQRVAKQHLNKDLHIVIVGDKAKVLPQLESVKGPRGETLPIAELDPWGKPLQENVK